MLKKAHLWLLLLPLLLIQSQTTAYRAPVNQDEDVPLNGVIIYNPSKYGVTIQLKLGNSSSTASWDEAVLKPGQHGTYIEKDRLQVLFQGRLTADRSLQYQLRYEVVPQARGGWDVQPKR